jgi:hypothetical protein
MSGLCATLQHSKDSWLGQTTDDIVEITVPSLLVPSLPNMGVRRPSEGAIGSCDVTPMWAMVVVRHQPWLR